MRLGCALVVALASCLIVTPMFQQGAHLDALAYASIARNMAEGSGSFWNLHLYWGTPEPFFEHPPLVMGLMSGLFGLLGDRPVVDQLFAFLVFILTILALIKLWTIHFPRDSAWVPVLAWISMPIVYWATRYTLLENAVTLFTLWAAWFFVTNRAQPAHYKLILFILAIAAAGLSKGLVGLFPLAMPTLWWLNGGYPHARDWWKEQTFIVLGAAALFTLLVAWPEARNFLTSYRDIQLIPSLAGQREVRVPRLELLLHLIRELAVPLIAFALLSQNRRANLSAAWSNPAQRRFILFMVLVGLSASLPLMISPKSRGFYVVPSLIFFATALATLFGGGLRERIEGWAEFRRLRFLPALLLLAAAINFALKAGTVERNPRQIAFSAAVANYIPPGEGVSFFPDTDWTLLMHLQRFHRIARGPQPTQADRFVIMATENRARFGPCNAVVEDWGFTLCRVQ